MVTTDKRFAVLIDADNISDRYIKTILDEMAGEGEVTYKRIYGDWTKPALAPWKKVLLEYSVTPIQQYSYTTGKNATDSAMIIDAMDILYSGNVEGFCLVTSDSDFTRLASRLRESGMLVVGMGEKKTPKAFTTACNKFKYLDILAGAKAPSKSEKAKAERAEKAAAAKAEKEKAEKEKAAKAAKAEKAEKAAKTTKIKTVKVLSKVKEEPPVKEELPKDELPPADIHEEIPEEEEAITPLESIRKSLINILREDSDEDGWVSTSDLGNKLLKRYSDFDVRNYGYTKLTPFLKSLKGFEMKSVRNENSSVKQVYLREEPEVDYRG
ncbi:MAG: NYN domain-containing protein [Clostridia bacterium]|nr:NYN domain-containing protein [Clostridia bacterium]